MRQFKLKPTTPLELEPGEDKWNLKTFKVAHGHKYKDVTEDQKEEYRVYVEDHRKTFNPSQRKIAKDALADTNATWNILTDVVSPYHCFWGARARS